jgi:selenocysteine lyase/cysteine desulfurase
MKCQKKLFSLIENTHYLNCAYKAPLLKAAENACIEALIKSRNPINIKPCDYFNETEVVKKYFAKIINAKPTQIAIVPSVSYGMGSVLQNTKAKINGNAITIKDEFPSGYFALKKWCKQNSNKLIVASPTNSKMNGESWNHNILNQINEQTSLVLMSSVHWMSGVKFDLELIGEKCNQVGAKFIIDGTQSVGAIEMDIKKYKIDALICASYKWLFGPYSLSLAFFNEDYNYGFPIEESWLNRSNSIDFSNLTTYEEEYKSNAGRYNVGETSNFILMPILKKSLQQIIEWNPTNIQLYCKNLIQPVVDFLEERNIKLEDDSTFCNHLFSIKLPSNINLKQLTHNLQEKNVFISTRGEYLRISVNVFNDSKDIEKLIHVLTLTIKN